jgi:hypothetical protein
MFSSGQWAALRQSFTGFAYIQQVIAGYLRASDGVQRHETLVATGGETGMTLAAVPLGTPLVLCTSGGLSVWRDPADYTRAGAELAFAALPPGAVLDVNYVAIPT